MSANRKKIKVTTPKGKIMWFKLTKPDTKFKKYQVDLVLEDTPELHKLMDQVQEVIDERIAEELEKAKNPQQKKNVVPAKFSPINEEYDMNGNATGRFVAKFRAPSEGKNKDGEIYTKNPPAIFDAKGKPIVGTAKEALRVMNGSVGQVNFEMVSYFTPSLGVGVSFVPKACLIQEMAEAGTDVSEYGFDIAESSEDDKEAPEWNTEDDSGDQDF